MADTTLAAISEKKAVLKKAAAETDEGVKKKAAVARSLKDLPAKTDKYTQKYDSETPSAYRARMEKDGYRVP